ncbi:hypothetical protein K435DRAFT_849202 [Dendrothele bispora CBS 962.96]|uniref:Uncharacterized protein n=1 Tax=Dendrothele bispora (strain CBS 962.96) TaxID=1314807 RepID=A0A4S8MVG4_DENBC|nr:hypothetical protein K435DRAFT_849202 [Dendrothele bispora CBS 962.96]
MSSFRLYDDSEHYSNTGPSSMPSTHNFYGIPMQALDIEYSNNYQTGDGFNSGHGDNVSIYGDPNLGSFLEPRIGFGWLWGEADVPFHARMSSALSNPSTGQDSPSPNEMVIPPQSMDIVSAVPTTPQLSYTQTSQVLIPPGPSTPSFLSLRVQDKQRLSEVNQCHHIVEDTRAGRSGRSRCEKSCDGPRLGLSPDQYSLLTSSTAWDVGSLRPLFNQGIHAADGVARNIQDHSINDSENEDMRVSSRIEGNVDADMIAEANSEKAAPGNYE